MPRRIQTAYPVGRRRTLTAIGDSLTHNVTLGVRPDQFWPERLAAKLRDLGCAIKARNFGVNGNTTAQMAARAVELTLYDQPDLFVAFGGVNDPGTGLTAGRRRRTFRRW